MGSLPSALRLVMYSANVLADRSVSLRTISASLLTSTDDVYTGPDVRVSMMNLKLP